MKAIVTMTVIKHMQHISFTKMQISTIIVTTKMALDS